jgi:sodium-dependent dicarboxylate transporter 2/3/5
MPDDDDLPLSALSKKMRRSGLAAVVLSVVGVGLAFFTGRWGIPAPAGVALVILVIAAALWVSEAVPLFVTSFLILLLCTVWLGPVMSESEIPLTKGMFLSPFFSDIILLFLGGFVLSAALHKYQLDEQLARWIIRRTGGSVPRLMLGIMAVTAFLSMWLSNTATAAMMLALVLPIVQNLPKGVPLRKGLVLSVPLAANIGGLGTPIGSPPNAIALQYMREVGMAPTFGMWMKAGVPAVIILLFIAWLLLIVLFKGRGRMEGADLRPDKMVAAPGITLVMIGTLLTVVGWMTSSYHGLSSGTVALVPLILFFGTGILNTRDLRNMAWDVLFLMGGGLCLGVAMSTSGLAAWVIAQLPVDSMTAYSAMVVFGILACVMSTVMSNTAAANLVMPIILGLSITPHSPILLGVAFACSLAMALPISTPPNAMAFSSGQLKVGDLLKPGLILTIIGVGMVFTVGYWWWQWIGII